MGVEKEVGRERTQRPHVHICRREGEKEPKDHMYICHVYIYTCMYKCQLGCMMERQDEDQDLVTSELLLRIHRGHIYTHLSSCDA